MSILIRRSAAWAALYGSVTYGKFKFEQPFSPREPNLIIGDIDIDMVEEKEFYIEYHDGKLDWVNCINLIIVTDKQIPPVSVGGGVWISGIEKHKSYDIDVIDAQSVEIDTPVESKKYVLEWKIEEKGYTRYRYKKITKTRTPAPSPRSREDYKTS